MHQSGDAAVNFGNTPPTAVGGVTLVEEKVVVTPVSGRHRSFKLGEYFSDTPGDTLYYVIVSSQLVSDTAAIDGDTLNVETSKSRSGDLVIAAVDAQGAQTQITFRFKVTNLTLAIFITLAVAVVVGIIVAGVTIWSVTHPLWKGELKVVNLDRSCAGMSRSHASFRGKLKLSYFMVGPCGLNADQCWFATKPGRRLKFCSKTPFYVNGMALKETDVYAGMTLIYADEKNRTGIRIDAHPDANKQLLKTERYTTYSDNEGVCYGLSGRGAASCCQQERSGWKQYAGNGIWFDHARTPGQCG